MMGYTVFQWMTFFYIYSFFGWIWESCYVSAKHGKWVNRGFLKGPMLPIYGSGAVMMLVVSFPFRGNYVLTYISGVIGATALEYVTGWVMEKLFKVRYWDYSNMKIQLHGYICLASSLTWGVFTLIMTDIIHPEISRLVDTILSEELDAVIVIIITVIFVYDTVVSAKAALDMSKALEAMEKLRSDMESMQVQIALLKKETADYMNTKKEQLRELEYKRNQLASHKNDVIGKITGMQKGLLMRNPSVRAERFEKSLKELKEKYIKQD